MKKIIYFTFWLTSATYCLADCPDGFTKHLSSCYLFVRIKATWPEAETYCRAIGADYATIENQDEQHFVESHLQILSGAFDPPKFWIGGSDFGEEGTWVWTQTNRRIDDQEYRNWRDGQDILSPSTNDHCLLLSKSFHWKWAGNNCDDHYFFICEKSAYKDGVGIIIG